MEGRILHEDSVTLAGISHTMVSMKNPHPFERLTPDFILDVIDRHLARQGERSDGRIFPLNSYENRVYQVGVENGEPLIVKFYRPGRWSHEQINEEHDFCFELAEHEIPVVTPLQIKSGQSCKSLFEVDEFRYALYPRKGGRAPEFDNLDNLLIMGRWLGRLHLVGAAKKFMHRPTLDLQSYGRESVTYIRERFIPASLKSAYESLMHDLLGLIEAKQRIYHDVRFIRTHCDCHAGNVLWRDDLPHFVDFDDARMAPAVQDIWMLLSGDRQEQTIQLAEVLEGYREFNDFDLRELEWIEVLRTLRMLHYSAWLARRWEDPAFPMHFPWFNTERYWGAHILELREQLSALQEPALKLL